MQYMFHGHFQENFPINFSTFLYAVWINGKKFGPFFCQTIIWNFKNIRKQAYNKHLS